MNDELDGCSVADVLERLEKGKIGHRAAMEWLNVSSYGDLVEIMHVNGRLMPGHQPDAGLSGDAGAGALDLSANGVDLSPNRRRQRPDLVQHLLHRARQRHGRARRDAPPACRSAPTPPPPHRRSATPLRACSGVRTPKPMAIGRSVARRMRGIAASKCSAVALRVPVMPVMLT